MTPVSARGLIYNSQTNAVWPKALDIYDQEARKANKSIEEMANGSPLGYNTKNGTFGISGSNGYNNSFPFATTQDEKQIRVDHIVNSKVRFLLTDLADGLQKSGVIADKDILANHLIAKATDPRTGLITRFLPFSLEKLFRKIADQAVISDAIKDESVAAKNEFQTATNPINQALGQNLLQFVVDVRSQIDEAKLLQELQGLETNASQAKEFCQVISSFFQHKSPQAAHKLVNDATFNASGIPQFFGEIHQHTNQSPQLTQFLSMWGGLLGALKDPYNRHNQFYIELMNKLRALDLKAGQKQRPVKVIPDITDALCLAFAQIAGKQAAAAQAAAAAAQAAAVKAPAQVPAPVAPVVAQAAQVPAPVTPAAVPGAQVPAPVAPVVAQAAQIAAPLTPAAAPAAQVPAPVAPVVAQAAQVAAAVAPVVAQAAQVPAPVTPVVAQAAQVPAPIAPAVAQAAQVAAPVAPVAAPAAQAPAKVAPPAAPAVQAPAKPAEAAKKAPAAKEPIKEKGVLAFIKRPFVWFGSLIKSFFSWLLGKR